MNSMDDEHGVPVEGASAPEDERVNLVHHDSQALLDALSRRARRLGRQLRRTKAPPERILKLMD